MFATVRARVSIALRRGVTALRSAARNALRPAPIATGLVSDLFRTRDELLAENAILRQQLIVACPAPAIDLPRLLRRNCVPHRSRCTA